ncbi:MAG: DUF4258 domain-containing protein, partial [Chloroflexi bacterium]|nr:DUF4258 domain-containing protein [Chloroflexota bacterium]
RRIVLRVHAIRRMFQRSITDSDVRHVLAIGDTIEEYSNDEPYPSRLVVGQVNDRALHVVVAYNEAEQELIVITTYSPDPNLWESDFHRRRP